jgi:predicted aspartyl protease
MLNPAFPRVGAVPGAADRPGALYADVVVAAVPTRALIDTGSAYTLLAAGFVRRHGLLMRDDADTQLLLADSRTMPVLGRLDTLIECGEARLHCAVLVVPELSSDVILGIDVLSRLKATIVVHKMRLSSPLSSSSLHLSAHPTAAAVFATPAAPVSDLLQGPTPTPP